jgi:hypothetical protein
MRVLARNALLFLPAFIWVDKALKEERRKVGLPEPTTNMMYYTETHAVLVNSFFPLAVMPCVLESCCIT